MSFISDLFDNFLIKPVSKRMLDIVKTDNVTSVLENPVKYAVPIGVNSQSIDMARRSGDSLAAMRTLRQLSINHETSRAAINARKRQIGMLNWEIIEIGKKGLYSEDQLMEFKKAFSHIGGERVRFKSVLDQLIEDTLVLDAFCFYKQKTVGGRLLRIIPIDGTTIKLRVDENTGLAPEPPEYAFEQWVRGMKVAEMTMEEMTYARMNPRSNTPYGLSPLETLILTIDGSLRAQLYNNNYLSDNNVPMGFLSVPPEWTPAQIKEYKEFFDAMIASSKDTAKIFPIPAGMNYQPTTKPKDFAFKEFFDYLDRKVAMLFDITPQELGLSLQQYKENATTQQEIGINKGLKPLMNFVQEIFTDLIQIDMGMDNLAFRFTGVESKYTLEDVKTYLPFGVISIDEVREDRGLPKLGIGNMLMQGSAGTLVSEIAKGSQMTVSGNALPNSTISGTNTPTTISGTMKMVKVSVEAELKAWKAKATNDFKKKGKVYRKFESSVIPENKYSEIKKALSDIENIEDISHIFNGEFEKVKKNPIDKSLKKDEVKKFTKEIKDTLLAQLKPFTDPKIIANITGAKKDDFSDIEDGVEANFDAFDGKIEEILKWSMKEGGLNALKNMGKPQAFTVTNEKFIEALGDRKTYIIDSVDKTTKEWLIKTIQRAKEMGLTNEDIANEISDSMEDISINRADTIVNTEVANAMQTTELAMYQEYGVEKKKWVLSEDIGDICGENASQGAILIDEEFESGDMAPPGHPNCRCYIQAVFKEEE